MTTPRSKLNEETVKNRYLLPFLSRLGFNPSELSFEGRVTTRIGRSKIKSGFYDILVKRGEESLFLVEAKREGEKLTEEDAKQGISYASLIRPMPPYVLLTNCNDSRLFDTILEEEITDKKLSPDSNFKVELPEGLIEEATSNFLGLSRDNLVAFSRAQAHEELATLVGSKDNPTPKFIPDLFVEREAFSHSFKRFQAAPDNLFVLIADSGSGKTCCLCDLTLKLIDQEQPVLFYRGSTLNGPLLKAIASDFDWTFSERISEITLVRRLTRILKSETLIIVIDGIDEWTHEGRMQDLLAAVRHLTGTNIKLAASCKIGAWSGFTAVRDTETGLLRYAYKEPEHQSGISLQSMSAKEFHYAFEKYRAFYGVGKGVEDVAYREATRSPFFMRVMFEVAQDKQEEPITLSSIDFFDAYFQKATNRLAEPNEGRRLLLAIARALFKERKERLTELDLADLPPRASRPDALQELLEYQVLERSGEGEGMHVSFYFSPLRDYLIAFHVKQWHEASEADLRRAIEELVDCTVHQEALAFFYRYASEDRQRLMDSKARARVEESLKLYETILTTDLSRLRHRFVPHTSGPIGYVGGFNPLTGRLHSPGLRELKDGQRRIRLLPTIGHHYSDNLLFLLGGKPTAWSSSLNDEGRVADHVLNLAIGHQLKRILSNSLLDESNEPRLAAETVIALVSGTSTHYAGEPHPLERRRKSGYPARRSDLFPLRLEEVRTWQKYRRLYWNFRDQRVEEKVASGEIPVEWNDTGYSYSADLTYEDMQQVEQKIADNIGESYDEVREIAPVLERTMSKVDRRLDEALRVLEGHGFNEIVDELFPELSEFNRWFDKSPHHIEDEICALLARALDFSFSIFVRLAEHNFPTLYQHFPSIRWRLITVVVGVYFTRIRRNHYWNYADLYICEASASRDRFIVAPRRSIAVDYRENDECFVQTGGEVFRLCETTSTRLNRHHINLNNLFRGQAYLETRGGIAAIIRTLVYSWLSRELPIVFAELCKKYGAEIRERDWDRFSKPYL